MLQYQCTPSPNAAPAPAAPAVVRADCIYEIQSVAGTTYPWKSLFEWEINMEISL